MNYNYLFSALIITLIIPLWGLLMSLLNKLIFSFISKVSSPKIAMFIVNWLTIPGVIHHELSHALLAVLTGAVVTEFRPFWPDRVTGSLGHVNFVTRGSIFIRSLQYTLVSTAPVLLGTVSSLLLFTLTQKIELPASLLALTIYLIFSIIVHASMSFADVKIMLKGIWIIFIAALVICLCMQLDLIKLIASL